MIRTQTLRASVFVVLFFLFSLYSQLACAQEVPCDNSGAESVIPTNGAGEPLMPKEIQASKEIKDRLRYASRRLKKKDIERCLKKTPPLIKNHVINFDWYVRAWKGINGRKPALQIEDSVLWSFEENGKVAFAAFGKLLRHFDEKITISVHIRWYNVTLGPSFSAARVEFRKGASFERTTFGAEAMFWEVTFGAKASRLGFTPPRVVRFGEYVVQCPTFGASAPFGHFPSNEEVSFRGAIFGVEAIFHDVTFHYMASFDRAIFGEEASFRGAIFGEGASFRRAIFGAKAIFSSTIFTESVSFLDTIFGAGANFLKAIFVGEANFLDTTFGADGAEADFGGTAFCQEANFGGTTFGKGAAFHGATFHYQAFFEGTTFEAETSFLGATFSGETSFRRATFGGNTSFRAATAERKLNFSATNWAGRADFRRSEIEDLSWDSEHRPSSIKGVFDAREAKFKQAVLKYVHFSDMADFSDIELGIGKGGNIIFENVTFEKEVHFLRAKFWNDAIFVWNRFRDTWDLTGAIFQRKKELTYLDLPFNGRNKLVIEIPIHLCLSFNRISKLVIERKLLGSERTKDFFPSWLFSAPSNFFLNWLSSTPLEGSRIRGVRGTGMYSCASLVGLYESREENERLSEVYKTIELSFREANDRQGENEAWYLGQVADRESQHSAMGRLMSRVFLDFPSRYGIDIYRVICVSISIMLFFAGIYWTYLHQQVNVKKWQAWVRLKPHPDQKRAFRFRPVEQFFESSGKQARLLHPPTDALLLSGRAFFKLGLGTTYPHRRGLEWIAYIEWIVGMYMLVHFLFVVKNTLPIALPFLAGSG